MPLNGISPAPDVILIAVCAILVPPHAVLLAVHRILIPIYAIEVTTDPVPVS